MLYSKDLEKVNQLHTFLTNKFKEMSINITRELYLWMNDYSYDFEIEECKLKIIDLQDDEVFYKTEKEFILWWSEIIKDKSEKVNEDISKEWLDFSKKLYSFCEVRGKLECV